MSNDHMLMQTTLPPGSLLGPKTMLMCGESIGMDDEHCLRDGWKLPKALRRHAPFTVETQQQK